MKKTSSPLSPHHYPLHEDKGTASLETDSESGITFDKILSKIGFGKYQLKVYFILGLILINDGAEAVVLSILQNILKTEWGLQPAENNFVGTAVFAGVLLGSAVAGKISDTYGRKRPIAYLSCLLYIAAMLSAFVQDYAALVIIRSIYGFLVGIQFPMSFTYLTEITPKEVRGKYLVLAGGFFTVGELFTCCLAFFTLDGVSAGNWRVLLIGIAQPALLCWLCVLMFTHESPRYLIMTRNDTENGVRILRDIAHQNNSSVTLGEEEVNGLIAWAKATTDTQASEIASVSALFKKRTKKITLCLWPIWLILCLCYYGMVYILPAIVGALNPENEGQDNNENLWSITLPVLGEFPSVLVGAWAVDKAAFGRKKTMIVGFLVSTILCILAFCAPLFIVWAVSVRMLLNGIFTILPAYTTELYPTMIRATGLGMASAFSRIGGALMTWMSQALFDITPKGPFLGFGCLCVAASIFCYLIPYDTTNKELDLELSTVQKQEKESDDNFDAMQL